MRLSKDSPKIGEIIIGEFFSNHVISFGVAQEGVGLGTDF